jgi:hypothetical protein
VWLKEEGPLRKLSRWQVVVEVREDLGELVEGVVLVVVVLSQRQRQQVPLHLLWAPLRIWFLSRRNSHNL